MSDTGVGSSVPKFGEPEGNDPAKAERDTTVIDEAREERRTDHSLGTPGRSADPRGKGKAVSEVEDKVDPAGKPPADTVLGPSLTRTRRIPGTAVRIMEGNTGKQGRSTDPQVKGKAVSQVKDTVVHAGKPPAVGETTEAKRTATLIDLLMEEEIRERTVRNPGKAVRITDPRVKGKAVSRVKDIKDKVFPANKPPADSGSSSGSRYLVPKFGEWEGKDPSVAERYTTIFDVIREEKRTGRTPVEDEADSPPKPPAKDVSCCFL